MSSMNENKRIGNFEFEQIRHLLKISADRIDAAEAVLVYGKKQVEVARYFGWTPQAISKTISKVWDFYIDYNRSQLLSKQYIPPGWDIVTFIAPKQLIKKFREEISNFKREFDS